MFAEKMNLLKCHFHFWDSAAHGDNRYCSKCSLLLSVIDWIFDWIAIDCPHFKGPTFQRMRGSFYVLCRGHDIKVKACSSMIDLHKHFCPNIYKAVIPRHHFNSLLFICMLSRFLKLYMYSFNKSFCSIKQGNWRWSYFLVNSTNQRHLNKFWSTVFIVQFVFRVYL